MNKILIRYRETLLYLIVGILAVLMNIGTFLTLYRNFNINEVYANSIAFFLTVLFAYFTNSRFVFHVPFTRRTFLQFVGMRIGTIFIDNGGLLWLISIGMNGLISKCIVNTVIIVINYLLSKLIIFKRSNGKV